MSHAEPGTPSGPELAKVAALTERAVSKAAIAVEEIRAALRMAAVVSRIGSLVAQDTDADQMVSAILDELVEDYDACCAHAHLVDVEKRELKLAAQHGLPGGFAERLSRLSFDSPFLASRAVRAREIQVVGDRAHLDRELVGAGELLDEVGGQSMVVIPFQTKNCLIGVVTLVLAEARTFSVDEIAMLDSVSAIGAVGLENALARQAERELGRKLSAVSEAVLAFSRTAELSALLQSIVDQARSITNAEFAALGVVTDWERPFSPWVFSGLSKEDEARIGRHPRPIGTLGEIPKTGEVLRLTDVRQHPTFRGLPIHHPNVRSFLGIPITFDGKRGGNLYLGNKRGVDGFTVEDEQAVKALGTHAGAALERARLHDLLTAERSRLSTILDNSPHGIVFVERDWQRIVSNRAADAIVGKVITGLARHSYLDQIRNADGTSMPPATHPMSRALRGEHVSRLEVSMVRADGTLVPVLVSAAPVRGPTGDVTAAVVSFENISRLKRLEHLREQLLPLVAHDLQNPLSSILTNVEGLLSATNNHHEVSVPVSSLEMIRKSALRLEAMLEGLLDAPLERSIAH